MNRRIQMMALCAGPLSAVTFFVGVVVFARLLPPPITPTSTAQQVVDFYSHHQISFLLGMICLLWGSGLLLPFGALVASQLQRIEGSNPIAARLLTISVALVSIEIVLPAWVFATLAFRSDWSPDIARALSDLAWLMFTWPNPVTIMMLLAVGVAVLADDSANPVYPRWVGFANISGALIFFPSCFLVLFKTGPIAWNGVVSFWLPAVDYGSWIILMSVVTYGAIKKQHSGDAEHLEPSKTPAVAL